LSNNKTFKKSWLKGKYPSFYSVFPINDARSALLDCTETEIRKLAKKLIKLYESTRKMLMDIDIEDLPPSKMKDDAFLLKQYPDDLLGHFIFLVSYNDGEARALINNYSNNTILATMTLLSIDQELLISAYRCAMARNNENLLEFKVMVGTENTQEIRDTLNIGLNQLENLRKGRVASAKVRRQRSHDKWKKLIEPAIDKWIENPGWTINDMANWLIQEKNANFKHSTICNQLKGKKSALFKRKKEF